MTLNEQKLLSEFRNSPVTFDTQRSHSEIITNAIHPRTDGNTTIVLVNEVTNLPQLGFKIKKT